MNVPAPLIHYGTAFLLGLSVAAPIGPVNVEIIRRGLTFGPVAALALGCGAVSADCIYFSVGFTATGLATSILDSPVGSRIAFLIGGAMFAWLGWMSLRAGLAQTSPSTDAMIHDLTDAAPAKASGSPPVRTYLIGLAMTLTNPMTILFWLSIAASFTAGSEQGSPLVRLAGVASGCLLWVVFVVLVISWARRWVSPKFLRGINLVSGLILLGFALRFFFHPALK